MKFLLAGILNSIFIGGLLLLMLPKDIALMTAALISWPNCLLWMSIFKE